MKWMFHSFVLVHCIWMTMTLTCTLVWHLLALFCISVLSWVFIFMYYTLTSSISNGFLALYGSDECIINIKYIKYYRFATFNPTLNSVDLTVMSNTECASIYGIITANKLCCYTPDGQSICYVSFLFWYSSVIHFLLSTTQNLLLPPRPPLQ
jgi:hypothetical protein